MEAVKFRFNVPPSANMYWRHKVLPGKQFATVFISEDGRAFREHVLGVVLEKGRRRKPFVGDLVLTVDVTWKNRVKRDLDNILKPLLDALTLAGVWGDDCQVKRLKVEQVGVQKPGWVDVTVEEMEIECGLFEKAEA